MVHLSLPATCGLSAHPSFLHCLCHHDYWPDDRYLLVCFEERCIVYAFVALLLCRCLSAFTRLSTLYLMKASLVRRLVRNMRGDTLPHKTPVIFDENMNVVASDGPLDSTKLYEKLSVDPCTIVFYACISGWTNIFQLFWCSAT